MTEDSEPRLGTVLWWLAVFVALGAFPFYLVWSFVNRLLAGRFEAARGGLAVLGLLILAGLLNLVVRRIGRWEGEAGEPGRGSGGRALPNPGHRREAMSEPSGRAPLGAPAETDSPSPGRPGGESRPLAPEEEPKTTGTLFIMILFLMALAAMWGLMYFTLLER